MPKFIATIWVFVILFLLMTSYFVIFTSPTVFINKIGFLISALFLLSLSISLSAFYRNLSSIKIPRSIKPDSDGKEQILKAEYRKFFKKAFCVSFVIILILAFRIISK